MSGSISLVLLSGMAIFTALLSVLMPLVRLQEPGELPRFHSGDDKIRKAAIDPVTTCIGLKQESTSVQADLLYIMKSSYRRRFAAPRVFHTIISE
ncbi:MAG: hypothetical protein DSZ00_05005 [Gammaproteobacteria bacterium]|nr:MAG: hypothetical protein DSZ00_05005 [Gammaproteobacteria bacterium]RTZ76373.1 MAG: hypothetical protein DSZ02_01500 [Gammaproteobacteria bacterium]